jgi:putative hydrolase of the HAD superfamily
MVLNGMRREKIKAVIFDLYGTLVDTFSISSHEEVLRKMAAVVGAPPAEFIRIWFDNYDWRAIGKIASLEDNIRDILNKLNLPIDEDKLKEIAQIRYEFTRHSLKPWPYTVEVLRKLKELGYKVALISDCSAETPAVWETTVMSGLIDASFFSCVVGMKKPDPRIYLQAAQKLGVEPEECLYVGDGSSQELMGARNVGMHPVLIMTQKSDSGRKESKDWNGPRISRLAEVLTLLEKDG